MTRKVSSGDRQTDRHSGEHLATDIDDNQVKSLSSNMTSTLFMTFKAQVGIAFALPLCRMKTDV